jgi:glycogen phosphorylase
MTAHLPNSLARASIAFLSMEIALETGMRCYSGGLGVLAGDYARAAADLGLPMVFVSPVSSAGYVLQEIDAQGRQKDGPQPWNPAEWATALEVDATIGIEGRPVRLRAWLHELTGVTGATLPVLLLDSDLEGNAPEHREITRRLYHGDPLERLRQEAVLGLGGKAVLDALGLGIRKYHLNEGHAGLLPLALLAETQDRAAVRAASVFTTHTPVPAGHSRFAMDAARAVIGAELADLAADLFEGSRELDMTRLALALSDFVNGVSVKHAEVSRRMFPGHPIRAVTNGVHLGRWADPAIATLFDHAAPGWRERPSRLAAIGGVQNDAIWAAHVEAKRALVDDVARRTGQRLDADRPIIGYARRMTPYKRADLLFTHLVPLLRIAERRPFQVLYAGKAHPDDHDGKALIARLHEIAHSCAEHLPVVFVPGYDMDVAAHMVGGCDAWLNTPEPPLEASGTSGMKAAVNGVLNLSVLDGWWIEGCDHGRNGWGIGGEDGAGSRAEHADHLLHLLEDEVLPIWYDDRPRWIAMMKQSIASLGPRFSADRAMRDYAEQAYGEAAEISAAA